MDSPRIKVEAIKTEKQFVDFIGKNKLEFYGMYLSDEIKTNVFWIKVFSDEDVSEIITTALEKVGFGYIGYAGKINGKYCNPEWLMNVISLEDGKSYLYFGGDNVRKRLEKLFDKQCDADDLLVLDKFLLRKQIMKKAREMSSL